MKAIYCLLSTINAQMNGWTCFGMSHSKKELESLADKLWSKRDEWGNLDIYKETYYKNYIIVCKTKADRVFHASYGYLEEI